MNIATIIEWLNKNRNYSIDSRFYDYIAIWTDWWRGYYKPFHQYKQINPDGTIKERQLYTMRMAKKVCRDWAAILLNEKTQIVIDDKAGSSYLLGDGDGSGGEFGRLHFLEQWQQAD